MEGLALNGPYCFKTNLTTRPIRLFDHYNDDVDADDDDDQEEEDNDNDENNIVTSIFDDNTNYFR